MPLITNASLDAHRVSYSALFQRGLSGAPNVGGQLATPVTSTTGSNKYGWLGRVPKFRKWIGERRYQSVKEKAYQLTNDKYTAEMELDEDDWADDNLGQYNALVQSWGQQAGELDDQMIFEALKNGHLRECYDGQNFFDTDHPMEYKDENGVVQTATMSNKVGADTVPAYYFVDLSQVYKPILLQSRQKPTFWMGTDANVVQMNNGKVPMHAKARGAAGYTFWQLAYRCTDTLNAAAWEAAKDFAASLKDEEGESLGIRYTHVFVGSENETDATKLFEAALVDGGDSNIYLNKVKVVVCPRL